MRHFMYSAAVLLLACAAEPQQQDVGPGPRDHYGVAYDPVTQRVLLFGGVRREGPPDKLDDLWSWDGTNWTLVARTGIPMIGHDFFIDNDGGVWTAGFTPTGPITAKLNGSTWSVVTTDTVPNRSAAAGAWDSKRKRFVHFGGTPTMGVFEKNTWEFNGTAWSLATTTGPSERLGSGIAYDAEREVVVLYGGTTESGTKLGDMWTWNGLAWTLLTPPGSGPGIRTAASMAYDSQRKEVILFGGINASGELGDTWIWNGVSWRLAAAAAGGPSPRIEAHMAFDARRGVTVLFGGSGPTATFSDTWEWNGVEWRRIAGPAEL